eukprot:6110677-Pyramimonas_sp.AAC.1
MGTANALSDDGATESTKASAGDSVVLAPKKSGTSNSRFALALPPSPSGVGTSGITGKGVSLGSAGDLPEEEVAESTVASFGASPAGLASHVSGFSLRRDLRPLAKHTCTRLHLLPNDCGVSSPKDCTVRLTCFVRTLDALRTLAGEHAYSRHPPGATGLVHMRLGSVCDAFGTTSHQADRNTASSQAVLYFFNSNVEPSLELYPCFLANGGC